MLFKAVEVRDCLSFYVGCLTNSTNENDDIDYETKKPVNIEFPADIFSYEGMTIETCVLHCGMTKFKYAALKNG